VENMETERGFIYSCKPILVAVRSKAWVCDCSLAGISGLNPSGGDGCLSLVSVLCCIGLINHPEESYRVWCV